VVAQGAAAALRTRPLPQTTADSLVVETFFSFFHKDVHNHVAAVRMYNFMVLITAS
jgi:hypothetical protein